jgi:hypothetical protein
MTAGAKVSINLFAEFSKFDLFITFTNSATVLALCKQCAHQKLKKHY